MNIYIGKDRLVEMHGDLGIQGENNATIIHFTFPEKIAGIDINEFNKYIYFYKEDKNIIPQLILNDEYSIPNVITQYDNIQAQIIIKRGSTHLFESEVFELEFKDKLDFNISIDSIDIIDNLITKYEELFEKLENINTGSGGTGENGKDGNGILKIEKTNTEGLIDTYIITYTNGDTFDYQVTNGAKGKDGTDGIDGKSAYQLALENGFEGTMQEWLESLKGSNSIVETIRLDPKADLDSFYGEGKIGTYYCSGGNQILGKPIVATIDAFFLWVNRSATGWYFQMMIPSSSQTNTLWLRSWNGTTWTSWVRIGQKGDKGDKGDTGETGPQGPAGTNGANGQDGYTPQKGIDYFTTAEITEITNTITNNINNNLGLILDQINGEVV